MTEPSCDRISPYPPYVHSDEDRRRWRVVTYAALATYGFEVGQGLSGSDRTLIWQSQRALYRSDIPTGDGDLLEPQREWLTALGLI